MKSHFKKIVKDEKYLEWLRRQPCILCGYETSWTKNEPHHVGGGECKRRSRDDKAVPLCWQCHRIYIDKNPEKDKMLREFVDYLREQYRLGKDLDGYKWIT